MPAGAQPATGPGPAREVQPGDAVGPVELGDVGEGLADTVTERHQVRGGDPGLVVDGDGHERIGRCVLCRWCARARACVGWRVGTRYDLAGMLPAAPWQPAVAVCRSHRRLLVRRAPSRWLRPAWASRRWRGWPGSRPRVQDARHGGRTRLGHRRVSLLDGRGDGAPAGREGRDGLTDADENRLPGTH